MNFVDFLNNIWETSKERIKTPITGAYSLAFILYNWEPILYLLLSSNNIEGKIIKINAEYHELHRIYGPLCIALIYVVGVPYIMTLIESLSKWGVSRRRQFKNADTIADMEHQVSIAESQYRIDQAKNGSKEQEEIKIQMDNLRTQNENITQQLEASSKIVERAQEDTNKVMDQIRMTNTRFSKLSNDYIQLSNFISNNKNIEGTLQKFDSTELARFMNYSQQIVKNENPTVITETANKLVNYDLFKEDENGWYYLTAIGEIAFKYISNDEHHGIDYNF